MKRGPPWVVEAGFVRRDAPMFPSCADAIAGTSLSSRDWETREAKMHPIEGPKSRIVHDFVKWEAKRHDL